MDVDQQQYLVNFSSNEITDSYYTVGPIRVRVKFSGSGLAKVKTSVNGNTILCRAKDGVVESSLPRIRDREVIVIG